MEMVDFIENELKYHAQFEPLIIARNREALKSLSEKIIIGIHESEVIIPVLTKKSINTQWINQEIGYAIAIKKKISPIVDKEIINRLKGFIHNQVDIPYNFIPDNENLDHFKETFKILIKDLEAELSVPQKKNIFLEGLEKVQEANKKKTLELKKQSLAESDLGFKALISEIAKIENEFTNKINLLKEQKIYPEFGSKKHPISFFIGKVGYISKIEIHQPHISSTVGSYLSLERWKGYININNPYEEYEFIADIKYLFYYNDDLKPIWKRSIGQEELSSEEIVENCFSWLIERILEKK
jgi:hypothetical protein